MRPSPPSSITALQRSRRPAARWQRTFSPFLCCALLSCGEGKHTALETGAEVQHGATRAESPAEEALLQRAEQIFGAKLDQSDAPPLYGEVISAQLGALRSSVEAISDERLPIGGSRCADRAVAFRDMITDLFSLI